MAIVLPAVGTWPGVHPVGVLEPGLDHTEAHVKALVETEHYLAAYWGAQHWSQVFPENLGTGDSLIHTAAAAYVVMLEYLIIPRHHCTALRFCYRVDGGAGGGDIQFTAAGVSVAVALAAGVAEGYVDLAAVNSDDSLITVTVEIRADGGGAVDLWALGCYDLNLTQAQLAAL